MGNCFVYGQMGMTQVINNSFLTQTHVTFSNLNHPAGTSWFLDLWSAASVGANAPILIIIDNPDADMLTFVQLNNSTDSQTVALGTSGSVTVTGNDSSGRQNLHFELTGIRFYQARISCFGGILLQI